METWDFKENNVHYNGSIHIAANAHIVTPIHKWIDARSEEQSNQKIGTTCRGIGPAYVDKYNRCGIRALDLIESTKLKDKVLERLNNAKDQLLFTSSSSIPIRLDGYRAIVNFKDENIAMFTLNIEKQSAQRLYLEGSHIHPREIWQICQTFVRS